jgi:predicted AlkP superfamily phosphohydrolase/phosphomutase
MTPSKRIVFLAMDAGDTNLIREWAADGTLPTMRSLLSRGLVGHTASVEGLYEGSTWPCLYTGTNPARHGFHRLTQIRPGTYEFYRCNPGEFIKREPFWNLLSRAGKKVAILDVPLSGISGGLNGIQMVEWGSHDAVYGFQTWPQGLKADVTRRFGNYPLGTCCDSNGRAPEDFCRFRDHLIEGVNKKCELTLYYLKQDNWDFFAQVFTEGHCAGHQCWHLHDPAHPNYHRNTVSLTGDPIREVYVAIDRAIGEILAQVDEDTLVVFLATHRMSYSMGKDFMLGQILEKLHVVQRKPQGKFPRIFHAATGGWNRLPDPVQELLKPALYSIYHVSRNSGSGEDPNRLSTRMDLEKCRCFPHENGFLVSGIRVNLSGREPMGLIKPGAEFDDFCRQLSEDLLDVTDRASGQPMVKRVMKTSDLFQGEYLDHLPDLLVEWNEEIRMGSKAVSDDTSCRVKAASDKIGLVEGEYGYCRTGDHRPEGLLVVLGPGIQPGTMVRTVSIMDLAPTFLHWFGLACDDLDGQPLVEILESRIATDI